MFKTKKLTKNVFAAVIVVFLLIMVLLLSGFSKEQVEEPDTIPSGSMSKELPIFDTHVHYKEPAWSLYTPEEIIELFNENGISAALVSSTPDDGTRMLYEKAPDIVVPFLRPYHDDVGSGNWHHNESIIDYMEHRLETPIYMGVGEFHIHNPVDADSEVIQTTVRLAVERDLYLHIHTGHEAVEEIFEYEPNAKILWAHAGMSDPPEVLSDMFSRYENLWVDISLRERQIAPHGVMDPEWRQLFMEYPDRITVGSDTWVNSQWERYGEIISFDREWLAQLPEDIAEQIAYGNAERLFR